MRRALGRRRQHGAAACSPLGPTHLIGMLSTPVPCVVGQLPAPASSPKRAAAAMAQAKQNYRVRNKLEAFYTGGTVRSSLDGSLLACACADEVKLLDAATGRVIRTFSGVGNDQGCM